MYDWLVNMVIGTYVYVAMFTLTNLCDYLLDRMTRPTVRIYDVRRATQNDAGFYNVNPKEVTEHTIQDNIYRKMNETQHMDKKRVRAMVLNRTYEIMNNKFYRKPYCRTCSEIQTSINTTCKVVRHCHYSSKTNRIKQKVDQRGYTRCASCRDTMHPYKATDTRIPIYVTASQACNWQGPYLDCLNGYRNFDYCGDEVHIEHLAIPGATIADLHHAFEAEWDGYWRPIDLIVCAGLNNLLRGHSVEKIKAEITAFKKYVEQMEQDDCTFAMCTLPLPPKLSRLRFDPLHPPPSFIDRTQDILDINDFIKETNNTGKHAQYTRRAPTLHTYGVTRDLYMEKRYWQKGPTMGHLNKHRSTSWREDLYWDKLHLNDINRMRIGRNFISYFMHVYGMCKDEMMQRADGTAEYGDKEDDNEYEEVKGEDEEHEVAVFEPDGERNEEKGSESHSTHDEDENENEKEEDANNETSSAMEEGKDESENDEEYEKSNKKHNEIWHSDWRNKLELGTGDRTAYLERVIKQNNMLSKEIKRLDRNLKKKGIVEAELRRRKQVKKIKKKQQNIKKLELELEIADVRRVRRENARKAMAEAKTAENEKRTERKISNE